MTSRNEIKHKLQRRFWFIRTGWALAIHLGGIEQLGCIDKGQACLTLARVDLAVEAGSAAGMARAPLLLDPYPDRILIAIHTHLDDALGLTRSLTFSPQRTARAAEIPCFAAGDGFPQGF